MAPLNQPEHPTPRLVEASRASSTHSFHLAMELGAALLLAGAVVNGVGIRNPPRRTAEPAKEQTTEPVPVPCGGCLAEREVTVGAAPPAAEAPAGPGPPASET